MVVFTCTLCQTDFNTRNAIERHQKNKHEQVDENKNEGTEIGQAHVSLEGGTETQSGVEMDIDENGTEDTPNICEILTDIVAFEYLNDMWNKYEDALPQLMKHIYSIFDNKCNRRSGMKRHQTKKHALVNRKHIKTNNATTIPRQFVKALNINGKSRNVYPDDEKPRKQSGLRRVKKKSGGMNVAIDALKEMYKRRQSELRSVKTKSVDKIKRKKQYNIKKKYELKILILWKLCQILNNVKGMGMGVLA